MRRYLIIALGLVSLGATFTPVSPGLRRKGILQQELLLPLQQDFLPETVPSPL